MKKFFVFIISFLFLTSTVLCEEPVQSDLEIKSQSAVLMDLNTKRVLFEKNSKEVCMGTSVMKIMNLLLAIEALNSGKLKESDTVQISKTAAKTPGANVWLKEGEILKVSEIIKSISMVSANDACVALAEKIAGSEGNFLSLMNDRASKLGMQNTVFKDCIGSDEDGNVTSAYDVGLMSCEIMKYKDVTQYTSQWIDHIRDGQTQIVNSNKLIKTYPGITGLKTGTAEKAGSCISATAEKNGMRLVAVALGCENTKDRYTDATALLNYGFNNFELIKPSMPEDMPQTLKVANGMKNMASLNIENFENFLVPKGEKNNIKSKLELCEEITAPIDTGFKIGKIIFKLGDETLAEYAVTTDETIDEISFDSVFKKLIFKFFEM